MPDLSERDRFNLENERIPSLKNVVYYSVLLQRRPKASFTGPSWNKWATRHHARPWTLSNKIRARLETFSLPRARQADQKQRRWPTTILVNNAKSLVEHLNNFVTATTMIWWRVMCCRCITSSVSLLRSLWAMHTSTNVYPAPGFSAEASIAAIEKRQCNYLIGTPTMFTDILHHPAEQQLISHRWNLAVAGGAPVTPQTVISAEEELNCTVRVRRDVIFYFFSRKICFFSPGVFINS